MSLRVRSFGDCPVRPVADVDGVHGPRRGLASKLPRPTRSLPPCGGRSLLEDGAFPKRHCAPQPHAWTRPDFLLPSCRRRGCIVDASHSDRRRGLSRRFNSRCPRALPQMGTDLNRSRSSFPSTGCVGIAPREPVYWWLLPTPACARTAVPRGTSRVLLNLHERASSPPYRSLLRSSRLRTEAPRYRVLTHLSGPPGSAPTVQRSVPTTGRRVRWIE